MMYKARHLASEGHGSLNLDSAGSSQLQSVTSRL
jgi:hypothetical protein